MEITKAASQDSSIERRHPSTEPDAAQLRLLPPAGTSTWRLSRSTREVGRRGIAQAREALRAARADGRDVGKRHSSEAA
jgi:hypothetical protein